jgi:hypothetical protein
MRELLAEGPLRQPLQGFEPVYRDIVDYIIRCTHRIWEEKNVGLCRTHYSDDCVMHTLAGPSVGKEVVTQNTVGSLSSYADRLVLARTSSGARMRPANITARTASRAARPTLVTSS